MKSSTRRLVVISATMIFALLSLLISGSAKRSSLDADLPSFVEDEEGGQFDKEEYMMRRGEATAQRRGISEGAHFDPQARPAAVRQREIQEHHVANMPQSLAKDALLAPWIPLGPAPIPNGQTLTVSTPVSGRTISIAVHPTNPDIVYVGAAQGGLYRTTDGGVNWTPLMDSALSLAIGAIAIAPSQPDTIYVGTGETGFCGDCFFGVGVYRIDNASMAAPVISGPFNDQAITDTDIFTGRGIGAIAVHPTNPAIIFVALGSGIGGKGGIANNVLPDRGLYRSTDATSADPSFTKMAMTGTASTNNAMVDVVIDPGNPDLVICTLADALGNGDGGIYRSTDASVAVPTFTRTFVTNPASSNSRTELALNRATGGVVTVYAASGTNGGTIQRSIDGGATWAQRIDNNFCTAQCFYDIGVAVDPTNADIMYVGGSPNLAFGRSINGGTSFTNNAATAVGLHVDSHAIAVAPSLPTTIYFGSDGGIYKTTNSGTNWTPLNNSQYSATQFESLAVHPIDRYFTIGGTQDNGTNFFQPSQVWTNTEGGDGGFTQIDQNAVNNTAVTMYHTFFNQTNAMGYSRSLNAGQSWQFFGCGFGGSTPNGMTCAASAILFYAPMERGPGNPNTLYFGSDVLYRSANSGTTMVKVSQQGTMGGAISAIGISPQDDNVRIVGTSTGAIFGTTTGANPLINLDALGQIPNNFVGRTAVDPNNVNTAYVTLEVFGVNNVWKTTDLNAVNPTWTAVVGGLPQVPVSGFAIDPQDSNALYAGTDIGVYQSLDGGTSWLPYGTGLPRVAVFDVEISNVHRILRIATHGRGLYEIGIPGTGIPVPRPAGDGSSGPGGASALVAESCVANNGAIDSSEVVTISYSITNVGGGPTTNLTATLQPTGGVMLSAGPQVQNYGAIPAGGTVTKNFTFTATGQCNGTLTPTFQLQDGNINYGIVTVTYTLGALVLGAPALAENFDGVVPPALPAGWTTAQTGAAPMWTSTAAFSDTAPNSAATDSVAVPGDNSLTTPTVAIPPAPVVGVNPNVRLSFRNNYNLEGGFDGGVLEISIAAGPFVDIVTAGGSFVSGGYNGTIGVTDSVLTGRNAWTGSSGGFITTEVILPPASYGQNAQLRWRTAYDTGTSFTGMRVDTISIFTASRVCCGVPTAAPAGIGGKITTTDGTPLAGVSVSLSGGKTARTITDSNGDYRFNNMDVGAFYTVTPALVNHHFGPESRSFSLLANMTEATFTATRDAIITGNAIDTPDYFVRQHYVDFLGREPDESGFNFWTDQITSCGADAGCRERRTINVSAAYFLSIEFQQTGGLVDGLYRASYGRRPQYEEFMPDTAIVARDVVVGRADWAQTLEANKQAFIAAWVERPDFRAAYDGLGNAAFVDALISRTGGGFNGDRDALVNALNSGSLTRATALRQVVENEGFINAKRNETFVMMQYFGYLRRNPDPPGYQFWLNKLNQFNGNFEQAEMVKAFIVSGEYRTRFTQ
ncbi:MAG: DUF4214 domain-containing protein [Pyrinomonadaceae bacterium]